MIDVNLNVNMHVNGVTPLLVEHYQHLSLAHGLPFLAPHLRDLAGFRGLYWHLHLHALEDDEDVAGGNCLAGLLLDLPDGASDVRGNVDQAGLRGPSVGSDSRKWVDSSPRANASDAAMRRWRGRFVFTPSTTNPSSAERSFAMAASRVSACTTSFASSES